MMANSTEKNQELHYRTVRVTYLVTYSRADLDKFPTRRSFAEAVTSSFESGSRSKAKVQQWVCSAEEHSDGGAHYHIAVKLTQQKRWKSAKKYLMNKHGISVHFSSSHDDYYTAYRYVTKEDKEALHSEDHPDLAAIGSPKTKACTKAVRRRSKTSGESSNANELPSTSGATLAAPSRNKRPRRLSNLDVSEVLLKNNIKRDVELLALAKEQKAEGKQDLAEFVLGKSEKGLQELITTTWKMDEAKSSIEREKRPRMATIKREAEGDCVEGCDGEWLTCAKEVLRQNSLHPYVFAAAVRELLVKGRGKFRNIMIVGPANCGKTFLLSPLTSVFQTFANPATTSYAWLGVEDAEVILLNDFRWSSEVIAWKEFLLLLEGQPIHFPAPKTSYARDIYLQRDTPIFATSKSPVTYTGKYNSSDERENEMMAARWKVFTFTHQIPQEKQKELHPCGKCFSELVLLGQDI